LTGFRSGTAELAREGEPREGYGPSTLLNTRYALKAAELGVSEISVRRWVRAFRAHGEAGLVGRGRTSAGLMGNVDARWLDACRTVLAEQVESSTKTKSMILRTVTARLEQQFGPGVVPIPGKTRAYEVLGELSKGRSMWSNSNSLAREVRESRRGPGLELSSGSPVGIVGGSVGCGTRPPLRRRR
jgi:hypothetical protein